jgi:hypothetical protein
MVTHKAKALIELGYQVIPVTHGKPLVKFKNKDFTPEDASGWGSRFPDAELAIIAGRNDVFVLDVDCDDKVISDRILNALRKKHKNLPIRLCNSPRFATIFRADDTLKPIGNASSAVYLDAAGKQNQIELAGYVKPVTMYGKHRKTKNPYIWKVKQPEVTPISDLPELGLEDIKKIFAFFEKRMCLKGDEVGRGSLHERSDKDAETVVTFDNVKTKKVYTDAEVTRLLERCTGDTRKDWLNVGMALHNNYEGSVKGLDIWDKWSSQFEGYQGRDDCREQWQSFQLNGGITMGTVAYVAKKSKKKEQQGLMDTFLKNKVLIATSSEVGDLGKMPSESIMTLKAFRDSHTHVMVDMPDRNGKVTEVPITKLWERSPDRVICHAKDYYPVNKRILDGEFLSENRREKYYNVYEGPTLELVQEDNRLKPFFAHMKYLFPGDGDFEWIISWLSDLVQNPHARKATAPLSISTFHGTGRGWLTKLMHKLVGEKNMSTVATIGEIVRSGAKNAYLHNTTLCVVNETYAGNKRYSVGDKLRTILGDDFQNVDVKYGGQTDQTIYTRFFMQSNHIDALVMDEEDRRIEVFLNRSLPKSTDYYDKLYSLLDDNSFLNQVYSYLMGYHIDHALIKKSRLTDAKLTAINSTKSPTAQAFFEFKQIVGNNIFIASDLENFALTHIESFSTGGPGRNNGYNPQEVSHLLVSNTAATTIRKIGTKSFRLYCFKTQDLDNIPAKTVADSIKITRKKVNIFLSQQGENHEADTF